MTLRSTFVLWFVLAVPQCKGFTLSLHSAPTFQRPSNGGPLLQMVPRRRLAMQHLPNGDNSSSETVNDESLSSCWNPNLRKMLAAIAFVGLLETSYLTYDKLMLTSSSTSSSFLTSLCTATATFDGLSTSSSSSCSDVLHGPYASISFFHLPVPLAALGMIAYLLVLLLASHPLLRSPSETTTFPLDVTNRIAILGLTTLMASFSIYLIFLLVTVLHTLCLLCLASAGFSLTLAAISWMGNVLPDRQESDASGGHNWRKVGVLTGFSSVGLATVLAVTFFFHSDSPVSLTLSAVVNSIREYPSLITSYLTAITQNREDGASSSSSSSSQSLVASTKPSVFPTNVPPMITTASSPMALSLASDLSTLHSRMYGAFWCSHCYDQKQALGKDAMNIIPYIECDGEGFGNQKELCREKKVPGYPTWEIDGQLFPGEKSLEELREIVTDVWQSKRDGK